MFPLKEHVLYKAKRFEEFDAAARSVIAADPDNGEMMMMLSMTTIAYMMAMMQGTIDGMGSLETRKGGRGVRW